MNKSLLLERFYCEMLANIRLKKQPFIEMLVDHGADIESREISTKNLL